jgi:hypothetical protein
VDTFDGGLGTDSLDMLHHGNWFAWQPALINFETTT